MTDKELAKLKKMRKELTHTKQGNYILHKYTDEYGMVITIDDMFSIIDRYLDDLEAEEDLISRRKLLLHLNDFALAEAPDERTPDVAKEYTAKDMQMMVYRTIRDCMRAIEEMK